MAKNISPMAARMHRLQGQLEGVEAMMAAREPISKILQQIEAVRGSLKALEKELLAQKINSGSDEELKRALRYLLRND